MLRMNIVYLTSFNLNNPYRGKERATLQKIEALRRCSRKFRSFHHHTEKRPGLFKNSLLDIKCAFYILKEKPDALIFRGSIGYLSILASKFTKTVTAIEIHGIQRKETHLLPFSRFVRFLIKVHFIVNSLLEKMADIKIFNHPFLLEYYKERNNIGDYDFFCYNGFDKKIVPQDKNKEDILNKYKLPKKKKILSFTGSASKWHGIEYLVALQKEFNKFGDPIQIVVGGGDISVYDRDGICINLTPLNEEGCSEILQISDLCLLPVKRNRVSPGSPLKLYDYVVHKRWVIAEDIQGYSDEVLKYGIGIATRFEDSKQARLDIVRYLRKAETQIKEYPNVPTSWDDRIQTWLYHLREASKKAH